MPILQGLNRLGQDPVIDTDGPMLLVRPSPPEADSAETRLPDRPSAHLAERRLDQPHSLVARITDGSFCWEKGRSADTAERREKEINYVLETIPKIIEKLRKMSPLWRK